MTREELKEHCQRQIQNFERVEKIMPVTPNDWKRYEEHKMILELLEQEPCDDAISRQAVLDIDFKRIILTTAKPAETKMNEIKDYEIIDKAQELNAVSILDKFCKTFCRYADDYERFNDLRFRCEEECPFSQDDGKCSCKIFKNKFAPNYKDFGCMGDL